MRQTLCIIMLFAISASTLTIPPPRIDGVDMCKTEHDVGEDFESKAQLNPVSLLFYPKMRCYATCRLIAGNFLNFDGTLNLAHMIEITSIDSPNRDHDIEVYKACANVAGADSCEAAFNTIKCMIAKDVNGQHAPV